jgi:hypothetical protein
MKKAPRLTSLAALSVHMPPPQVIMSHNIDFQVPMKKACANEIQEYCATVPHGDARVIRCLQDNKYAKDFGKECKEEVGVECWVQLVCL